MRKIDKLILYLTKIAKISELKKKPWVDLSVDERTLLFRNKPNLYRKKHAKFEEYMQNNYKCSVKIWDEFNGPEKHKYNDIRALIEWPELYHTKIKNEAEIIDVTAHNIACQLVWNGRIG